MLYTFLYADSISVKIVNLRTSVLETRMRGSVDKAAAKRSRGAVAKDTKTLLLISQRSWWYHVVLLCSLLTDGLFCDLCLLVLV